MRRKLLLCLIALFLFSLPALAEGENLLVNGDLTQVENG